MSEKVRCPNCQLVFDPNRRSPYRPDPQPDDDIMDLAEKDWGRGHGVCHQTRALDIFRLIQTKIQKNNQLFGGLDGKVDAGIVASNQWCRRLEHKLEVLEGWIETIGIHSEQFGCLKESELGRKVEELEEGVGANKTDLFNLSLRVNEKDPQPQAKGEIARDKDGHPLIPGVSVLGFTYTTGEALFRRVRKDKHYGWVIEFTKSHNEKIWPGFDLSSKVVWVRDLDFPPPFPQDSGSSRAGGEE